MVVPMLRPDVFGALASHAGDALFESCYQRDFPVVVRELRDRFEGSYEVFFERLAEADHFDWSMFGKPFEMYGYACAYSPDPERPGEALLPFELATGKARGGDLGALARARPRADGGRPRGGAASMRRIYLDAGRGDEYFLDLGAQAFAAELEQARGRAHARAVRRQARRDRLPLSGSDPRAGAGARASAASAAPACSRGSRCEATAR